MASDPKVESLVNSVLLGKVLQLNEEFKGLVERVEDADLQKELIDVFEQIFRVASQQDVIVKEVVKEVVREVLREIPVLGPPLQRQRRAIDWTVPAGGSPWNLAVSTHWRRQLSKSTSLGHSVAL